MLRQTSSIERFGPFIGISVRTPQRFVARDRRIFVLPLRLAESNAFELRRHALAMRVELPAQRTPVCETHGNAQALPVCLVITYQPDEVHRRHPMATLAEPVSDAGELFDPNVVKVVTGRDSQALYFSRSAIPFLRDPAAVSAHRHDAGAWKRHIGLYAYRAGALRAFTRTAPAALEKTEKLEQLRFLESGRVIVMARACAPIPTGVDTPEDLEPVRSLLADTD